MSFFNNSEQPQENTCSDNGDYDLAYESVGAEADHSSKKAAEQSSDESDDQAAHKPEATTFHDHIGKKTGNKPYYGSN